MTNKNKSSEASRSKTPSNPRSSHTRRAAAAPALSGDEGDSITVRVYAEDKARIVANAEAAGLSLSEYARAVLLGKKVEAKQPVVEVQAIAKLESIRGLLKQLWKSERFDTAEVFSEVNKTLRWLRK